MRLVVQGALQVEITELTAPAITITTWFGGVTQKATGANMSYTLPAGMQVQVGVQYQDANGNPAQVDGAVQWASSDDELLTIVPVSNAPDGYPPNGACTIEASGATGSAQVTATVDADLGSGMRELVTMMTVEVIAGEAVAGVIAPIGDPTPIA